MSVGWVPLIELAGLMELGRRGTSEYENDSFLSRLRGNNGGTMDS